MEHAQRTHHARPARPLLRLTFGGASSSFIAIGRADERAPQTLAILPFEIRDTSGESGSPDKHNAMLAALTRIVGEKIEAAHVYKIVPEQRVATAVAAANSGTFLTNCNGCELDIARSAGADQVMIGWIYKVSTLVGSLHIEIKDVASGKRNLHIDLLVAFLGRPQRAVLALPLCECARDLNGPSCFSGIRATQSEGKDPSRHRAICPCSGAR